MSAALGQPVDRRLTDTRDYLRAEFGYGTATEIADLFRALAVTCVQRQVRRVLIVAGDDDPAGERALRDALKMMLLAGIPSDFKLALVAASERGGSAYRNAHRDLCAAGITARVFDGEDEATRWLDSKDVSTQGAAETAV
jgi:hypothetical protein